MPTYIEERTYYPDGYDPTNPHHVGNVRPFTVGVFFRGDQRWMVAKSREGNEQLSRTGRWLYAPSKLTAIRHCRFGFELACRMAEMAVTDVEVHGMSWARYLAWAARKASS